MIATIKNPHIQTLCKLAQEDESTLQFPLPDQIYGFHAQQSCEKLFKALIAANNRAYPFTHSLEKLSDILMECGESLPSMPYDPIQLEPFAVELRYDLGGTLSDEEKKEILESLVILREYVLERVLELEKRATP
jgi:HEPN domain-containing protein